MEKLIILLSIDEKELIIVYGRGIQIKRVHHHRRNWNINRNWSAKSIDSIEVSAIPDNQAMIVPQLLDIPHSHTSNTKYQQYVKYT